MRNQIIPQNRILKKKPNRKFSKEEDDLLIRLVQESGNVPIWSVIARSFESRTAKQCRERYNYYLNPDLNSNVWTEEDDLLLLKKYNQHGPKWSLIMNFFPGRSNVSIKNHFAKIQYPIKKKQRDQLIANQLDIEIKKFLAKPRTSGSNISPDFGSLTNDPHQNNSNTIHSNNTNITTTATTDTTATNVTNTNNIQDLQIFNLHESIHPTILHPHNQEEKQNNETKILSNTIPLHLDSDSDSEESESKSESDSLPCHFF